MSFPIGGTPNPNRQPGGAPMRGSGALGGWQPGPTELNETDALNQLIAAYQAAVQAYNANPSQQAADAAYQAYAKLVSVAGTAGSANQGVAGIMISNPNFAPENQLRGNPASVNTPGGNPSNPTGAPGATGGISPTGGGAAPAPAPIGGGGIASQIARRYASGPGGGPDTGAVGAVSPGQTGPVQQPTGGGVQISVPNVGAGGSFGGGGSPVTPNPQAAAAAQQTAAAGSAGTVPGAAPQPGTANAGNYVNNAPMPGPGDPNYGQTVAHTIGTPAANTSDLLGVPGVTGMGGNLGWAGEAGLGWEDIYGDNSPYNPYSQNGLLNILNLYESQNGLPAYWSDQMLPFVRQQVALSYLQGEPVTAQGILAGIPGIVDAGTTAGQYFDPAQGWGGFLQNGGVAQPGGGFGDTDIDMFGSLAPEQQVAYVNEMWGVIAGGSVDPTYVQGGSYMISELGNQFLQLQSTGQLPPGVTNFIDFLRFNGADTWL